MTRTKLARQLGQDAIASSIGVVLLICSPNESGDELSYIKLGLIYLGLISFFTLYRVAGYRSANRMN